MNDVEKLVADFVDSARTENGFGYFYGNTLAVQLAKKLSKNQLKRYYRYEIIPAAFFLWLREASIVKKSMEIPKGGATMEETIRILGKYYIQTEQGSAMQEYKERRRIKKYCEPVLNHAFGLQDKIWERLAEMGH